MSRLEKITRKNYRSNFPVIGFGTSLVIGGLLTYFGVVKANPIISNSDCYFGTVTQNIIGDSSQNIVAKINNVTQGQEYNDTTDVNGYYNICVVGIEEENSSKIAILGLKNYPNPFSSNTRFDLKLPERGKVSLDIYDISGRLVRTVVDANLNAGNYRYGWDGKNNNNEKVSNGNYFYRLNVNGKTIKGKLTHIQSQSNNNLSLDNLIVNPNESDLIVKPDRNNVVSSLADSLVFSLADTLRFYSWIEANPSAGENNRIMITLDWDTLCGGRDKLEHLKYSCFMEDTYTVLRHKLVRWLDQDIPIAVFKNLTEAVPYDSIADTLIDLALSNWESKTGLNLFTIVNDSLSSNIIFHYPDSIPGGWGFAGIYMDTTNGYYYITKAKPSISKELLELYPDDALVVFGHEIGHDIGLFRHSTCANDIMHPSGGNNTGIPSVLEGQVIVEIYSLLSGHPMGPHRYRGDLNPGPTSSSSVDHEKLLREFPPDLEKLLLDVPTDLKFENFLK